MISQETKERIRKESLTAVDNRYQGNAKGFEWVEFQDGYTAGAEAEATRAEGLVKALEALNKQLDYYWNTSRARASRDSMPETIKRGICAAQKDCAEALNNYNKPDK